MSEYEKVMSVLFDRGLPSETCGKVANAFEKKDKLERQLAEAREFIEKYGEFRNAPSKIDKQKMSLQLDAIYLQLKEQGK